jgi:SIR2-like protein
MTTEPPYGVIWNRLKAGKVVPFLGAGASFVGRPPDTKWNADKPAFLPSGLELAHFLADETMFPSVSPSDRDDLAKVSSYYSDISGRRTLRECLRKVLNHDYKSGPLHEFLASLPTCVVIVVTNYDTLIEQAFQTAGKVYDLVIYPADPPKDKANTILWWPQGAPEPEFKAANELDIDLDKTNVIFEMHGTIVHKTDQWDNFVITEEDYVEFLSRITTNTAVPALFYEYFRERSFLFLGYSLRDWNLRVVLKNLRKYLSSKRITSEDEEVLPSWAIQRNPSELERKLWEKRNVNIFDIALDEFVNKLRERQGGG